MANAAIIIGWIVTALGLAGTAAGAIWWIASLVASTRTAATAALEIAGDHETRLRTVETTIPAMAANIEWIRESMENGSND